MQPSNAASITLPSTAAGGGEARPRRRAHTATGYWRITCDKSSVHSSLGETALSSVGDTLALSGGEASSCS
ncbi:hypothetical protein FJT64_024630 [Amphibalanus amphitrite]|uniref:Uncharacterized protein n=1 Tax=Amphibalanus amphitrite TaxID=1232801 RepID=A0A6A4WHR8_AMPAM|nr:hypothetical protein FJT64_024630 [Amphibalanus amphitrite]